MDNEIPPLGSQDSGSAQGPSSPGNQPPPASGASPAPPIIPPRLQAVRPSKNYGWKISVGVLSVLLVLSFFAIILLAGRGVVPRGRITSTTREAGPRLEEMLVEEHNSANKILVVPIEGVISSDSLSSSADYNLVRFIKDQFRLAKHDTDIKAVILKVDSPGGEVLASDDINRIIMQFQNETGKPVIASMGNLAASGGYYVSAPCRWIVANELTLTGSIGVIIHSYNIRALMDKVGVRPEVYKSGKYKDMLSFDKKEDEITPEEREMVQKLINETYARFKTVVADGRAWSYRENTDEKSKQLASDWADYADGRVLSGKEAYKLGFVDELGNFETAVSRAKKLAKIQNANLVQYQQVFDLSSLFRIFGESQGTKIKVDVGLEVPKLKAGQLYYLAPTFVH